MMNQVRLVDSIRLSQPAVIIEHLIECVYGQVDCHYLNLHLPTTIYQTFFMNFLFFIRCLT